MDKEYFDARFDGLEKIMRSEKENMLAYVGAVSKKADKNIDALAEHEDDLGAHGIAASSRADASIVQWAGLAVSVVACATGVGALIIAFRH